MAFWAAPLSRDGPGLLLRDLGRDDPSLRAPLALILAADADVLVLSGLDWDADGAALSALAEALAARGAPYPHRLALRPNAGAATGLDMDGDGRRGTARDAQGYGRFLGDGGLAVLSRLPLGEPRDLSGLAWRDLPGARLPVTPEGAPFPSEEAQAAQRLSSTGHWVVPVLSDPPFDLLAFAATPPLFDGPEDRNGLRNADEIALAARLVDGAFGGLSSRFVVAGLANLDPLDGEGRREEIAALLLDPRLQDPRPASQGGAADASGAGEGALDTAAFAGGARLRLSYVLPSAGWEVLGAGVLWPAPGAPLAAEAEQAGPHRLVWADLGP